MTQPFSRGQDRAYDILLLESEPDDIEPFVDAFEATDKTETVHVISDGAAALDFLHQRGDFADAPRPDLVLLDLHLTEPSGADILAVLSDHDELRRVPVIAVTASTDVEAVTQSYELHANAHVQRPTAPAEFEELAGAIEQFWLRVAHLPPK